MPQKVRSQSIAGQMVFIKMKAQRAALKAIKKLAKQGDFFAVCRLADCYALGAGGVELNLKKAQVLYFRAAHQGFASAQYLLGEAYAVGEIGMPLDAALSLEWFNKSAALGHPKAQFRLATMYTNGSEGVPKDVGKAVAWAKLSAAQMLPEAQNLLGCMHLDGVGVSKDHVKAAELFTFTREVFAPSQFFLAWMHAHGLGGLEKSMSKAMSLYLKSAHQGYPAAQLHLGVIYAHDRNIKESTFWYSKAAAAGSPHAYYAMGKQHTMMASKPFDERLAYAMMSKASSMNYKPAQIALKSMQHRLLLLFIKRYPESAKLLRQALADGKAKELITEWFH